MLEKWLKNIHSFVLKTSEGNLSFQRSLQISEKFLFECDRSKLGLALNGGKDSTAVLFFTLYMLLRIDHFTEMNKENFSLSKEQVFLYSQLIFSFPH